MQLITNLVRNSMTASETGSIITIRAKRLPDEKTEITITDQDAVSRLIRWSEFLNRFTASTAHDPDKRRNRPGTGAVPRNCPPAWRNADSRVNARQRNNHASFTACLNERTT
jgi:hypothetical protein